MQLPVVSVFAKGLSVAYDGMEKGAFTPFRKHHSQDEQYGREEVFGPRHSIIYELSGEVKARVHSWKRPEMDCLVSGDSRETHVLKTSCHHPPNLDNEKNSTCGRISQQ